MPRKTFLCEKYIKDNIYEREVKIEDLNIDLIPLENDLLTMGLEKSFREIFLEREFTSIYLMARAICNIQSSVGIISKIKGVGKHSRQLANIMETMRTEFLADSQGISLVFDEVIIIDRSADFTSPLLTQLTYFGLLDENFKVTYSFQYV